MLNRTDVERIIENTLKDLSISVVKVDDYISPNDRKVVLSYKDIVISETYFDVVEQQDN